MDSAALIPELLPSELTTFYFSPYLKFFPQQESFLFSILIYM